MDTSPSNCASPLNVETPATYKLVNVENPVVLIPGIVPANVPSNDVAVIIPEDFICPVKI